MTGSPSCISVSSQSRGSQSLTPGTQGPVKYYPPLSLSALVGPKDSWVWPLPLHAKQWTQLPATTPFLHKACRVKRAHTGQVLVVSGKHLGETLGPAAKLPLPSPGASEPSPTPRQCSFQWSSQREARPFTPDNNAHYLLTGTEGHSFGFRIRSLTCDPPAPASRVLKLQTGLRQCAGLKV